MLVDISVNGKNYELDIPKGELLIDTLRDRLDLTGTKRGCDTVNCGACKVLIGGRSKKSCSVLTTSLKGEEVITIEGLSQGDKLDPIQEAFIDAGAIQCGYCTPGMIIEATSLLNSNPNPSDRDIKEAFEDNLCRCTGYFKILQAIRLAIEYRGLKDE